MISWVRAFEVLKSLDATDAASETLNTLDDNSRTRIAALKAREGVFASAFEPEPRAHVGMSIDDCCLRESLSVNTTTEVWCAERGNHLKAIKIAWTDGRAEFVRAILREADILQQLRNAQVQGVAEYESHAVGIVPSVSSAENNAAYLRTTFFSGQSLWVASSSADRESLDCLLRAVINVAMVLGDVHRAGIIHRDIKPDNVIYRKEGDDIIVQLIDFGAACRLDKGRQAESLEASRLATRDYLSPEMAWAVNNPGATPDVDTASDIWQLGRMLERLLERRRRYGDKLAAAPSLRRVCDTALQDEPQARFHNAEQFANALDRARKMLWRRQLRSPIGLTVAAGAAAAIIMLAVFVNYQGATFEVPALIDKVVESDRSIAKFGSFTVVRPGGDLRLSNLTRIELPPNAIIFIGGRARLSGTPEVPAIMSPLKLDETWRGIHVVGSSGKLSLEHLRLTNGVSYKLSSAERDKLFSLLPSGLSLDAVLDSDGRGGLASVTDGSITAQNVEFKNGKGKMGGAIFARATGTEHSLPRLAKLTRCRFAANVAADHPDKVGGGGAIALHGPQRAVLTGCEFLNNETHDSRGCGGALYIGKRSLADISECEFHSNAARGDGGACFVANTFELAALSVIGSAEKNILFQACTFNRNRADRKGGAIAAQGCTYPRILESSFTGNTASDGGAIQQGIDLNAVSALTGFGNPLAENCTFRANLASIRGSDISTVSAPSVIVSAPRFANCTFESSVCGSIARRVNLFVLGDGQPSLSAQFNDSVGLDLSADVTIARPGPFGLGFFAQPDENTCQSAALAMLMNHLASESQASTQRAWDPESVYAELNKLGVPVAHSTWTNFLETHWPLDTWKMIYEPDVIRVKQRLKEMITERHTPVLMSVGFTPSGHVILVTGYRQVNEAFELVALDSNGFFERETGYSAPKERGQAALYPLDLCRVTVEYRLEDQKTVYRKKPQHGEPLDWRPTSIWHEAGEASDWEFMVRQHSSPEVGTEGPETVSRHAENP